MSSFRYDIDYALLCLVQDADKKGLSTITDDVKSLAGKARSNTLKPSDYEVRKD